MKTPAQQIKDAKEELEEKIGVLVDTFCDNTGTIVNGVRVSLDYPHGLNRKYGVEIDLERL